MPRRLLVGVLFCLTALLSVLPSVHAGDEPRFYMGFKLLADMIPDLAGQPLEDERHNALNGDGLQMTTRGLMVWRKADNWTAFTNGWWTWVNGPLGLQDRANYERFEWEADAAAFELAPNERAIVPLAPTSTPLPVAVEVGNPGTTTNPIYPTQEPSPTPSLEATPTSTAQPTSTTVPTSVPTYTATSTVVPTQTPRPTSTTAPTSPPSPTSTSRPTSTVSPTATQPAGGVRSPDPSGSWVTSVSTSTRYYCSVRSTYWQTWTAGNRIWFQTEAALLAAYPNRVKHD